MQDADRHYQPLPKFERYAAMQTWSLSAIAKQWQGLVVCRFRLAIRGAVMHDQIREA
ncbi:hypothetical protein CZ787_00370 [Halomonas citrativorans]|uniref:Uncharacterized protein n=1 Tax=Halomonas citrativorans TaxID=2742612 RepID=A0A1R4HN22_9GAMM|nr:hypothetical protein [Halomonas citrativorans]SJN08932.1 hypothetical protein CZ787_00370 [Halomonas citrativorans]